MNVELFWVFMFHWNDRTLLHLFTVFLSSPINFTYQSPVSFNIDERRIAFQILVPLELTRRNNFSQKFPKFTLYFRDTYVKASFSSPANFTRQSPVSFNVGSVEFVLNGWNEQRWETLERVWRDETAAAGSRERNRTFPRYKLPARGRSRVHIVLSACETATISTVTHYSTCVPFHCHSLACRARTIAICIRDYTSWNQAELQRLHLYIFMYLSWFKGLRVSRRSFLFALLYAPRSTRVYRVGSLSAAWSNKFHTVMYCNWGLAEPRKSCHRC
mgnify:CR=1 FL=1